jgi:hypothetical protein
MGAFAPDCFGRHNLAAVLRAVHGVRQPRISIADKAEQLAARLSNELTANDYVVGGVPKERTNCNIRRPA